jgi:hypothetical protein
MAKEYSLDGLAGCVAKVTNPVTGAVNRLYEAEQAWLDPAGGRWVTVCDMHATVCNHRTLELAKRHLPYGEWCEACQDMAEQNK